MKVNSDNIEIFNVYDQKKVYICFCDIGEVELIENCNKTADNKRIFTVKTNRYIYFLYVEFKVFVFLLNVVYFQ